MNSKKNDRSSSTANDPILSELRNNERDLYADLMSSDFDLFASSSTSDDDYQRSNRENGPAARASNTDGQAANDLSHASNSAASEDPRKVQPSTVHRIHKHQKWLLIIGAVMIVVIAALGIKAYMMPSPTTPRGYANYERSRIVHNLHKNEPGVTVTATSTNHEGILSIHTNLKTTNPHSVKTVWGHVYDEDGNPKYNCDEVKLYGAHGLLCEGNAQAKDQLDYGSVTQHNNKLPGGRIDRYD